MKYIFFCWYKCKSFTRSTNFTDFYELLIPGLRIWVSLGCSVEERFHLQPVDVDIRIKSSQQPRGCDSDQLSDVVCYKTVTEQVINAVKDQPFNLMESLAARIFKCVAKQLKSDDSLIEITVTKPNHPVPHVQKGIVFKYCRKLSKNSISQRKGEEEAKLERLVNSELVAPS